MLGICKKAIFSINIYLFNLWYLAALKTLNISGRVILALNLAENVFFFEALLFWLYSISFPNIKWLIYFM